ncbi:helix-turn-helix domain-containing protein [Pasteurella multocida]|uniref:helix-turn-helix domain-containing protein n=1 Tax=Pasteurella multocida TaxID=747 RepID=UPI001CE06AED|nr:helix-turn-helix domain-containing protein [Pasteurella multocida]UBU74811.1 helix-turn-helix domain-containing protein [Pasteurella multocida]UZT13508.1 helix-turn-helix domain-containing protein [Pasteurella multocida]UZT16068.1 helix-turn-helix domain-containing protein [Pasteurella multocida]UZU32120.1 helix-turn-helix domain-containing protein [Pasteurella multocida]UZU36778.1 helix-turn-helix domain-containing protein [Pasteurella multocida]
MSMRLMAQAMSIKVGNPLRKLVLIKLADNANDDGVCFPSYQYIADVCEISKASARNHIDALIEMGLVSKKARKNKDGSSSNLYFLHLDKGMPADSTGMPADSTGMPADSTGMPADSTGGMLRDSTITSHSLEPVNESNTPLPPKVENSDELENAFDVFWKVYKIKVNKSGALKSFKSAYKKYSQKTQKSAPQEFAEMLVCDVQKRLSLGQFGFDKLHPTTYLNNARWEDEYTQPAQFKGGQPANDSYQDDGSWAVNSVIVQDGDGKVRVVDRDCEVVL